MLERLIVYMNELNEFPLKSDLENSLQVYKEEKVAAVKIEEARLQGEKKALEESIRLNYKKEWANLRNRIFERLIKEPKTKYFIFEIPSVFYEYFSLTGDSTEVKLREIFNTKGYEFYVYQDQAILVLEPSMQKNVFWEWLPTWHMFETFMMLIFGSVMCLLFSLSTEALPFLIIRVAKYGGIILLFFEVIFVIKMLLIYLKFKIQMSMQKLNNLSC